MSDRWVYGSTVARPVAATSAAFPIPAGDSTLLAIASLASNSDAFFKFGESTVVATAGDTLVEPGTKQQVAIPPSATHYAIIGTAGDILHFRGREGAPPPITPGNYFSITPLTLGRVSNIEGPVTNGRYFGKTGSGGESLSGVWDMLAPEVGLVNGGSYFLQCNLRARVIATGETYIGSAMTFIIRCGSHPDLWDATGTISTVATVTTGAGFTFISATFPFNSTNKYLGCLAVSCPAGLAIEITDVTIDPAVTLPDPWDDTPDVVNRTISLYGVPWGSLGGNLPAPVLIPPGATEVNLQLTYNATIAGEITSSAYVFPTVGGYVGFAASDFTHPTKSFWWRADGDEPDLWITIPITTPHTTTGHSFSITFRASGLSALSYAATFRVDPAGVAVPLPGTMPFHRPPALLDTSAATPLVNLNIPAMQWADTGFVGNVAETAPGAVPCWRSRLSHGYSQDGNQENGLYTNTDAWPTVAINPTTLETDSNARPLLRMHTTRFPTPVPYGNNSYPFQACVLTTQKMYEWNHQTGIWRFQLVSPSQRGAWSAAWCIGQRTNTNPRQTIWPPEMDFFEHFNAAYGGTYTQYYTSSTQHVGVHGSAARAKVNGLGIELNELGFPAGYSTWTQIHDFACLMETDWITSFVDGIETFKHRNMLRDSLGGTAWAMYPIINVAVKADPALPYDIGTTDMLVYGMQYFEPTSAFTVTDYTVTPPYPNRQILPAPDLRHTLSASFSGTGTVGSLSLSGAMFQDDFNRADGPLTGTNWTFGGGVSNKLLVEANAVRHTALTIDGLYTSPDFGVANHFTEVVCKYTATNLSAYVLIRVVDINNWIGVRMFGTSLQLQKRVAGTFTAIGTNTTVAVNDVIRIEATGTAITVRKNGTSVITATVTDFPTATKTGLYGGTSANFNASPWIDDYKSGPL